MAQPTRPRVASSRPRSLVLPSVQHLRPSRPAAFYHSFAWSLTGGKSEPWASQGEGLAGPGMRGCRLGSRHLAASRMSRPAAPVFSPRAGPGCQNFPPRCNEVLSVLGNEKGEKSSDRNKGRPPLTILPSPSPLCPFYPGATQAPVLHTRRTLKPVALNCKRETQPF